MRLNRTARRAEDRRQEVPARPRVLVTDGDNVGVLATIRGLARDGYEPWVAVVNRRAPVLRSRTVAGFVIVPDPCASATAFACQVAEVAAVIEPVAILPGGETGMTALAAHRELFPSTCTLAACEPGAVAMATDKTALPDLAESAGLRMPQTFEVTEAEVARRLPLHLPVVVKPPRSQVSRDGGFRSLGVQLARTREAVVRALHAMPDGRGLIQRYHPGSLSALAGVVWEGRLVAAVHQRALRTWPTDCGEMSFAVALPRDLDREAGALRLLERVGWSGLFQMQFLDTSEGSMLIDLNPRVYGSLALALGTGQNLPGIWADLLLGREFPVARYRTDVCFRNELLDMYARTVGRRVAGARRLPGPPLPRQTVNAFFESGDPMPLVAVAPIVAAKLYSRRRRAPAVKRAG